MLSNKQVRHHITKLPTVRRPLTWLQHRGLRKEDIFIASYPRSGSTWLRFMLFEILTGQDPTFTTVDRTIAGVGKHQQASPLLPGNGRLLQTHEPYRDEYKRAIYLVRDVRDVIASEYDFCRRLRFYNDEFDSFFERFLAGKVNRYGFWADHVNSWLDAYLAGSEHVLVVKFEEMKQSPEEVLKRILTFLDVTRDESVVRNAVVNNSVPRMQEKEDKSVKFKSNADGIRFISKGAVGKGQQRLSDQQMQRLEQCVQAPLIRLDYSQSDQIGKT